MPVDGFKPDMIEKLQSKGFTIHPDFKDVLEGEFNGTDVIIHIVTNNNKVVGVGVADENSMSESNIKLRFNNLLRQFQHNQKYIYQPDSLIDKYLIPQNENIAYETSINNKRYEAVFFQKTASYDSLVLTRDTLFILAKEALNNMERERYTAPDTDQNLDTNTETEAAKHGDDEKDDEENKEDLTVAIQQITEELSAVKVKIAEELYKSFNKIVKVVISENSEGYYITILYINDYNRAKGEDL